VGEITVIKGGPKGGRGHLGVKSPEEAADTRKLGLN